MLRRSRVYTLILAALAVGLGCEDRGGAGDDAVTEAATSSPPEPEIRYDTSHEDLGGLAETLGKFDPRGEQDTLEGNWRRARVRSSDADLSDEEREIVQQLESLGYAEGSVEATGVGGVRIHQRARVAPGMNFLTSGHEPSALLLDPDGRVLHRWARSFEEIWPDSDREPPGYWRRAHLFPNGDVLAIFEGQGIARLTSKSEIIWASDLRAHHDIFVAEDGDVFVLTREVNRIEGIHGGRPFLEDFIVVLDSEGKQQRKVSVLRAFLESPHRGLFNPVQNLLGDLLHTNSLEVLDGGIADRAPEFASGRVLISMAVPAVIAVVDLDRESFVWAHQEDFKVQHDPKILANGNLMFFDNSGKKPFSRVLEIDPATRELRWMYSGTREAPFFSQTCGTAQRLENDNTLVTESDNGRAIEITPLGEIVWEFVSPYRAGPEQEFVATLFEVLRLPTDFPLDWVDPGTVTPN